MGKQAVNKLLLFVFVFITAAFAGGSNVFAAALPSMLWVDTPTANQVLDNKNFNISGWALNASGVKEVKIYVDGAAKGTATYGVSRPDVNSAFPGYASGDKSGYTYTVDINTVSPGTHKISVNASGNDGTSRQTDFNISITKKAPITCVDAPANNAVMNGTSFDVAGWSLNASGISAVQICLDGKLLSNASYGARRDDVNAAFPGYPNGYLSGFSYKVDVNAISPGAHKLSVISLGKDGTSQQKDFNITIIKKVPLTYVDAPANNATIKSTSFDVFGWSLNPSGVSAVQIYVDGKLLSNASYGARRDDVNAAFPGYPNGNLCGFSYKVDVTTIPPGAHKVSVISLGNDGTKQQTDRTINISKKQPLVCVDSPVNNYSTTQRDLTVEGWTLNESGIKVIQYYLNGQLVGTSADGVQRPDVNSAIPGYLNGMTSGFSFTFNVMKYVAPGTQNVALKVVSIGNDGTSSTMQSNLVLTKLPERVCIDTPQNNDVIKNNIFIAGWALNASGVSSVNVYVDNVLNGSAAYGSNRPDVNSAYSGYTDGCKSGYSYNLDISNIAIGKHTIRVDNVGFDGRTASQSTIINVYGIVSYESYNYTLDYMSTLQLNVGAVYQNTTTWTWDPANYSMVRQYVDAPSITNDSYARYELLKLSYNDGASLTDLNNILCNKGILANKGQVFLNAGKANNINPIYLVSHALLETGNGTSKLSNGILVTSVDGVAVAPKTVYNCFGIGAYDSDANRYGSEYAYKQGWDTVDKAIIGGAAFISNGYINSSTNQSTLYKMRWNPASPGTHQYATDVRWAYNQVSNIKKLIDQCNNSVLYFNVPVFQQ